jgi:hypothetical protein
MVARQSSDPTIVLPARRSSIPPVSRGSLTNGVECEPAESALVDVPISPTTTSAPTTTLSQIRFVYCIEQVSRGALTDH